MGYISSHPQRVATSEAPVPQILDRAGPCPQISSETPMLRGFHSHGGTPKNGWCMMEKTMENPLKIDDLGVPWCSAGLKHNQATTWVEGGELSHWRLPCERLSDLGKGTSLRGFWKGINSFGKFNIIQPSAMGISPFSRTANHRSFYGNLASRTVTTREWMIITSLGLPSFA